jgi:hypothetical protein
MSQRQLKTTVAFFIFNRPYTTEKVFAEIAKAKPPKLLVVADGPHPDRPGEVDACATVRAIINHVDWKCEVLTNYSDVNLGCRRRVASGLNWVFDQVEEAIILEDDCLPHPSFFRFCEELLEIYRHDERVMHIAGSNFQFGRRYGNARRLSEKKPVYQSIVAVGPMPDDNACSLLSNLRLRNHTETNDGQAP